MGADDIIGIALIVLVVVGFWWTRGAGGLPGGTDSPARESVQRYDELGDSVAASGSEEANREREIE